MSTRTVNRRTDLLAAGHLTRRSHHRIIAKIRILAFMFLALSASTTAIEAASHYIRDGGTASTSGTGSCISWADACDVLPSSLVRGDTYYFADGIYPGRTFNTASAGTAVVTLKKATAIDHGTDTGWLSAYGDGQATFGTLAFTTSYWTIDGSVGSMTSNGSAYGFTIDNRTNCSNGYNGIRLDAGDAAHTNFIIRHIAFLNCTADIFTDAIKPTAGIGRWMNSTIADNLFDHWAGAINFNGNSANQNIVVERNYFINGWSSATNHGEQINANSADVINLVVRHNVFKDNNGTGTIVANNSDIIDSFIYGNLFVRDNVGNGIISGTSVGDLVRVSVYNNTFVSKVYGGGWVNADGGSGNVARNNLIFGMPANVGSGFALEYNAYFQTTSTPAESTRQVSSANPFVNSSAGDYHLAVATTSGVTLAAPFNTDPDGNTRGSDGVWDRGAFERGGSSSSSPPAAPTNLRIGN